MAAGFTREQAYRARNVDLAAFLLQLDPIHYRRIGCSVRLMDPSRPKGKQMRAVSVKLGANWWHDFSTGETKNAVKYLTERLNYNLVDAIKALSGEMIAYQPAHSKEYYQSLFTARASTPPVFPEPTGNNERQMYAYLMKRGIPVDTIRQLSNLGVLYQSKKHNNLVFINKERDFAEIRGTYSTGGSFHSVVKNRPDRFWYFAAGKPEKVYICEAAIDAISLYQLKLKDHTADNALYVSIAGVSNQKTIDRIRKRDWEVILAVDNDAYGQACRDRNPDLNAIIPVHKDWNEDLLKGTSLSIEDAIHKARSVAPAQDQDERNCPAKEPAR